MAILGASVHSLGNTGLKQSAIGLVRSTCPNPGQWNAKESFGRFVGKVYLAHNTCLGRRHLFQPWAFVASSGEFWNCSSHLGPNGANYPKENTLRWAEGERWRGSGFGAMVGVQVLEAPISGLPIPWAQTFQESLTRLEMDFLYTCSPEHPSQHSSKRCLGNSVFSLLHLRSPIKVFEKSHNSLLPFLFSAECAQFTWPRKPFFHRT